MYHDNWNHIAHSGFTRAGSNKSHVFCDFTLKWCIELDGVGKKRALKALWPLDLLFKAENTSSVLQMSWDRKECHVQIARPEGRLGFRIVLFMGKEGGKRNWSLARRVPHFCHLYLTVSLTICSAVLCSFLRKTWYFHGKQRSMGAWAHSRICFKD